MATAVRIANPSPSVIGVRKGSPVWPLVPSFLPAPGAPEVAPPKKKTVRTSLSGAEINPEQFAAMSASVAAFLGRPVRILSMKKLKSSDPQVSAWAQQGRIDVQGCHCLSGPRFW